ncbi:MAG: heavy metal translocating P-type ATPase, partial [Campylobacterota bacterium]|nr:heavy metal translocating P-type ATPase [Campylobacterota bacterium]
MKTDIKLLHQTPNRARYYCSILEDDINIESLKNDLKTLDGIDEVRINKKAKSIVFTFKNISLDTISEKLYSLDESNYKTCNTFLSTGSCYDGEEKPSKVGVLRSAGALALEPFISDDRMKFALTAGVATPMLINGTKELFEEGLTSGVLEALA